MAISRFLNCRKRVKHFCNKYTTATSKPLTKDDILQPHHWSELEYLYNHLETFYKATLMVKGNVINLTDHF